MRNLVVAVVACVVLCVSACASDTAHETAPSTAPARATTTEDTVFGTIDVTPLAALRLAPVHLDSQDAAWCGRLLEIADYSIPVDLWGGTYEMPELPSPDHRFPTVAAWRADLEAASTVVDRLLDDAPAAARNAMARVRRRHQVFEREGRLVASEAGAARLIDRFSDANPRDWPGGVDRWADRSCPPVRPSGPLAPFADVWSVHAGAVTIGPSGRGTTYERPYETCDGSTYPCELFAGSAIVGDIRSSFRITSVHGNVAVAQRISTNDPDHRPPVTFTLVVDPRCDELYVLYPHVIGAQYPYGGSRTSSPATLPKDCNEPPQV